ncbi:MAG: hypothetical protein EAZ60_08065 [Oscillatoriales cyanobacterium]|nr:MAG: hypothetical protein EAZ60_08065 [Oscillatoriales cyanobacterium]
MGLERKMFRGMFSPSEVVRLKQPCFTPGRLFEAGNYNAAPVKGKSAENFNAPNPQPQNLED